jgi:hypothetical protein
MAPSGVAPIVRQINKTVDRPQQAGGGNMSLKREFIEQRRLTDLPLTHHRFKSPAHTNGNESAIPLRFNSGVFQHDLPNSSHSITAH